MTFSYNFWRLIDSILKIFSFVIVIIWKFVPINFWYFLPIILRITNLLIRYLWILFCHFRCRIVLVAWTATKHNFMKEFIVLNYNFQLCTCIQCSHLQMLNTYFSIMEILISKYNKNRVYEYIAILAAFLYVIQCTSVHWSRR